MVTYNAFFHRLPQRTPFLKKDPVESEIYGLWFCFIPYVYTYSNQLYTVTVVHVEGVNLHSRQYRLRSRIFF